MVMSRHYSFMSKTAYKALYVTYLSSRTSRIWPYCIPYIGSVCSNEFKQL